MNQPPLTTEEWDELPPVLTTEQVARVFGVRPDRVLQWVKDGSLPALEFGRYRRFSKERLLQQGLPGEKHDGAGSGGASDR